MLLDYLNEKKQAFFRVIHNGTALKIGIKHFNSLLLMSISLALAGKLSIGSGVLTPTLQSVCNWFATRKKMKSRSGCKGREKVFLKSPTSRRLKSVVSCLLNMHKRLAATEFDREEVA